MEQSISILGSTGSIGRQSLDVVRMHPQIKVGALTAGSSVERMAEQCREFRPKLAVMATEESARMLADSIRDLPTQVLWGEEGLITAATLPEADCVITAVVGMLGLRPTLAAIRAKKRIGLANKETLVCAGELVMEAAKEYGIPLKVIYVADKETARNVPAPVTTYALFRDGKFLTQSIQSDKKFLVLAEMTD